MPQLSYHAGMATMTYTLTLAQFIDAHALHLSFKPRWFQFLLVFLLLAGLVLLGTGLFHHKYGLALGGLVYCLFPLLFFKPMVAWRNKLLTPLYRRTFLRSPSLTQTSHLELQDGVLHVQSDTGAGKLPWNFIIRWAEDENCMLLYLQPRLFLILPKQADPQPSFLALLREQLLEHVGPARR